MGVLGPDMVRCDYLLGSLLAAARSSLVNSAVRG